MWVGEHFGFGALMTLVLIIWGRSVIKDMTVEMSDLNRAVTLAILAMSFAPKGIQDQAEEIKRHVEARQARRAKP